jgi:hypothetical protein
MVRKIFLFSFFLVLPAGLCFSQGFIKTGELFKRQGTGNLSIIQDQAIDSLISRYIISNKKVRTPEGTQGMNGFRIQVYYSSVRTAREESARVRANFINKFPDMISYAQYQEPGWFMVRVGDYRTKTECYKDLILIRQEFPNAYPVQTVINFPDQNK